MTGLRLRAYETMEEEALIAAAQSGDKDAESYLLSKYKKVAELNAKSYFLTGADREDLIQEGMIGLYKAIRGYDKDKAASFKSFANICINKEIISAVRRANRKKHSPLNSYVSMQQTIGDGEVTLESAIGSGDNDNPENIVISKESVKNIESKLSQVLSSFEYEVLTAHLNGYNYKAIAKQFDRNAKSIDNALQRIKKKLARALA